MNCVIIDELYEERIAVSPLNAHKSDRHHSLDVSVLGPFRIYANLFAKDITEVRSSNMRFKSI